MYCLSPLYKSMNIATLFYNYIINVFTHLHKIGTYIDWFKIVNIIFENVKYVQYITAHKCHILYDPFNLVQVHVYNGHRRQAHDVI